MSQPGHPSSKPQRLRTPFLKKVKRSGLRVMQRTPFLKKLKCSGLRVMQRRAMLHSCQGSPNAGDTMSQETRVLDLSFHLLDMCPWASLVTFLSLTFLICITAVNAPPFTERMKLARRSAGWHVTQSVGTFFAPWPLPALPVLLFSYHPQMQVG